MFLSCSLKYFKIWYGKSKFHFLLKYSYLGEILTNCISPNLKLYNRYCHNRYPDASWNPIFASYGNEQNTYSSEDAPERIDYLMYWRAGHISMSTLNFTMPCYTTKNRKGDIVSLSDHEALSADFFIEKRSEKRLN